MGRRLPLVVLLTGVLVALPALAAADPVASVTTAKWHGDRLNLNLLAKSVPVGIAASQVSAIVTIGDTAVPAQVIIASSEVPDTSTAQTLMLVIDSSGSMTGARWRATQRAVDRFLDAAPLSARIGVVAFSNKARLQLAPTDDHDAVRRVVSNIRPNGDTALFDAVSIATRTLGNRAPCALLVLTDGEDTTSEATLESAASLLGESTCTTSFVGLQTSRPAFTTLRQLAEAGRGRAYSAENAEGIAGVFVQSFSTSNASIVLAADFPAGFTARDQSMSIALIIASSTIGLTARAEPTGAAQTSPAVSTTLLALALGMFVGVALLVWLLAEGSKRARTRRIETLIEAYALQRVVSDQAPQQDTLLETVEDLVRSFLVRANRRRRTELQLDGAARA